MKLIILLISFLAIPALANVDCSKLSKESSILCKQNKRILQKLSGGRSSGPSICSIKYCTDRGGAFLSVGYNPNLCSESDPHSSSPQLVYYTEAKNRLDAKEQFAKKYRSRRIIPNYRNITEAIIHIECD